MNNTEIIHIERIVEDSDFNHWKTQKKDWRIKNEGQSPEKHNWRM